MTPFTAELDLGYQQITNISAAQALTIPAGCRLAIVTATGNDVRWRADGTDPTATIGYPLPAGVELQYTAAQLPRLKFIQQAATAVLNINYFG